MRQIHNVIVALVFSPLALTGCDKQTPAEPAVAVAPNTAAPAAPTPATPTGEATHQGNDLAKEQPAEAAEGHEACGGAEGAQKEHAEGAKVHAGDPAAGCENVAAEQLEVPEVETVKRPDGTTATHVGHTFAGAEEVQVSALLADPAAYSGKKVMLQGDVSAMCGHRRGWFAIAAEDKSGRQVRLITAPTFLVPAGSVGKSAIAEGVVEIVEIPKDHAKHLAEEHKLEDPDKITADVKQVVIRTEGAEFF